MGKLSTFPGGEIKFNSKWHINISPQTLIQKDVKKLNLKNLNSRENTLPLKLTCDDKSESDASRKDKGLYIYSIDHCYLADGTRYDISFKTSRLARFMQKTTRIHVEILQLVVWYLNYTKNGIILNNTNSEPLRTFKDFDCGESIDIISTSAKIKNSFGTLITGAIRNSPQLLSEPVILNK